MRAVGPADSGGEPYEDLPGGGWYNAGNRATNDEFSVAALERLGQAGARVLLGPHLVGPIRVGARVAGANGQMWLVLIHGTIDDTPRAGMRRTDTLKKAGFDVRVLREFIELPILVVTSHLAADGVAADLTQILRGWADEVVAVEGDLRGFRRLCGHFGGPQPPPALPLLTGDQAVVGEQLGLFGDA